MTEEQRLQAITEMLILVRDNLFRGMSKSIQKLQARSINEVLELPNYTESPQQQAEPVAWTGYDLDGMVEAFSRVIEAHYSSKSPFHNPIDTDAKMALRILRGFIPAMKAYAAPPQRPWVGLTDEEIAANRTLRYHFSLNNGPVTRAGIAVVETIEAMLKAKNHG